jgi:non-ribosomal peptide synthetase component F
LRRTNDGIEGNIVFNRDFFDDATISQMMRHYERVLATVAVQPRVAIEDIELLSDAEKHQQLVEWNATTSTYPSNTTLHEIFAEQVQRQPQATAIVFGDESVTYSQLDARANRVARLLVERGIARQDVVGILFDRSIEMIVAILGVLKSGGALPATRSLTSSGASAFYASRFGHEASGDYIKPARAGARDGLRTDQCDLP